MDRISFFFWHILKYFIYSSSLVPLHKVICKVVGCYRYYKFFSLVEAKCLKRDKEEKLYKAGGIYLMFDGRLFQAGLADNLRAATSVFHLCMQNDRTFKIYFTFPFVLAEFLVPNKYDWLTIEEEGGEEFHKCKDVACFSYRSIFVDKNDQLQKKYLQESFNSNKNVPIKLYTNTFCYDEYFNDDFHDLFKPSYLLQQEIEKHKTNIGTKFISVSFRFSNLLGDLDDNFGSKLPEGSIVELINKCIDAVENIKNTNPNFKILVTTDSMTFSKVIMSKLNYVYMIPGPIGHVGHNGEKEVVIKTFLDLLLISCAEKVYMVRTKEMYKSGFAYRAALMGNKQFIEQIIQ